MKELTCIICPNGCQLTIDADLNVSGNMCDRGKQFALQEIQNPQRTITTTCKTKFIGYPVVPVKSDGTINKDLIKDVIKEINKITISDKLGIGDIVIENVLNTGVNIVLSSNILKEG